MLPRKFKPPPYTAIPRLCIALASAGCRGR
jgi:hypothetical protein